MAEKSQQNFALQIKIWMEYEFSNNPSNKSHSIRRSTGLVVSKMLRMRQSHDEIYIHGNGARAIIEGHTGSRCGIEIFRKIT